MTNALAIPHFNILTFPLGGAQRALNRVKRMFGAPMGDGVFVQPMGGAAAVETTLGLKTNLVAWWELDEASGNRADSHTNGLTLTDSNTVTSNPGVGGAGTAAQFTAANSETLYRTDEALLSGGAGKRFTWGAFIYIDSTSSTPNLMAKRGDSGNFEYFLRLSPTRAELFVSNDGTSLATVRANTFGNLSTATWYFVCARYDGANIYISVNAGTEDSASFSADVYDGNKIFALGSYVDAEGHEFFNGRMAKAFIFNTALTTGQISQLYNGGAGRTYSEL